MEGALYQSPRLCCFYKFVSDLSVYPLRCQGDEGFAKDLVLIHDVVNIVEKLSKSLLV